MSEKVEVHIRASEQQSLNQFDSIFIDDIVHNERPRKVGNCFALWYRNGDPLITIGPHCNRISRASFLHICYRCDNTLYNIFAICGIKGSVLGSVNWVLCVGTVRSFLLMHGTEESWGDIEEEHDV